MHKVVVTVIGTQKDETGEESRVELTTVGTSYEKNGIRYVTYKESEVSGMEGTTTLIKLYANHFSLIRMGAVEQKQDFIPGETSHSHYITPFGSVEMCVCTKRVEIVLATGVSSIEVTYELEINGQWQSSNTLSVKIREEEQNECQGITG